MNISSNNQVKNNQTLIDLLFNQENRKHFISTNQNKSLGIDTLTISQEAKALSTDSCNHFFSKPLIHQRQEAEISCAVYLTDQWKVGLIVATFADAQSSESQKILHPYIILQILQMKYSAHRISIHIAILQVLFHLQKGKVRALKALSLNQVHLDELTQIV